MYEIQNVAEMGCKPQATPFGSQSYIQWEIIYAPDPPISDRKAFFGHFSGEGMGVHIWRPYAAGLLYAPPSLIQPPTPSRVFSPACCVQRILSGPYFYSVFWSLLEYLLPPLFFFSFFFRNLGEFLWLCNFGDFWWFFAVFRPRRREKKSRNKESK